MLTAIRHFRLLVPALLLLGSGACGATGVQQSAPGDRRVESASARPGVGPDWAIRPTAARVENASLGNVATTDPIATEVGMAVLRRGGNAVDAAVATHFALAVVNPEAGNIGGGGFMVARWNDGRVVALDFREKAPGAATRDMYLPGNGAPEGASLLGHLAAGVPGSVAGMWQAHDRFGSLPWDSLLAPAIAVADGFTMHARLATSLERYAERLRTYPTTAATFLPGGDPPRVGDRFSQPDLAATLRRIAAQGSDGFYRGTTARLIAEEMQRGGGLITAGDLAAYEAVWRDPIVFRYRGHQVISMPPSSSGGATMAELLGILEGYDLTSLGYLSAGHIHLYAEASRRAFADRNSYLGDPDFVVQPIERMISADYAAERRRSISRDRATPSDRVAPGLGPPPAEAEHTTHYSIVDGAGNAVSVTTTINSLYGNLVTVAGAGFLLNNEMDDFATRPGSPNQFGLVQGESNAVAPGKRMLSAMTPTIVTTPDGHLLLVTGSPGGSTIISTVAQMVSNVVDWEMDLPAATAAPRLHHQHLPDVLRFEHGALAAGTVATLREMGHVVSESAGYQGDVQSIMVLPDGRLIAVGDPR